MVLGQFRALGTSLEVIRMEPGVSYCYDRVAVCQPSGARPAWQSIRRSQLKPERNGALLVPTRRAASQMSSKVRVMCGLQDAEDEVAYDDNGGSTVAWAPPRTARVIIRNHSSRPRVMDMPQVLRVMRKHFAHVEVLEVAASPSTADFCTQVGWMQRTDLVLTHHGSHVASAAYMQRGAHLIEVLPHRYERDDNGNGCAPRARHILVGRRTVASAELPAACRSLTAQQAILSRKCRKVFARPPCASPSQNSTFSYGGYCLDEMLPRGSTFATSTAARISEKDRDALSRRIASDRHRLGTVTREHLLRVRRCVCVSLLFGVAVHTLYVN